MGRTTMATPMKRDLITWNFLEELNTVTVHVYDENHGHNTSNKLIHVEKEFISAAMRMTNVTTLVSLPRMAAI